MGLVVLPTMLRHGYDPRLAAGTVAAAATLAQIIPPSTVLVVLGDQLNNAYQTAQLASGIFAPRSVSVGDLFAGAMLPGLLLVGLYLAYLIAVAALFPKSSPALPPRPREAAGAARLPLATMRALVPPLLLIVAVLGSILGGLATPTEAAAVGAVGAILLAALRSGEGRRWPAALAAAALLAVLAIAGLTDLRAGRAAPPPATLWALAAVAVLIAAIAGGLAASLLRLWRAEVLRPVMGATAQITSMIFLILIGATLFSLVFRGLGGDDLVHRALADLPGGATGAVAAVMLAVFLLGFVMDVFEIVFVVVPIVAPALLRMDGVDPVWLGIMIAINLQTSFLHPPLGATLFYLRGVAPPEITTRHIYVGIIPFVLIQLVCLAVLWSAPGLATWLPGKLYGR
jgi:TRAP-type mannitol/chloroaromatic compound transport system permease large subunit